MLTILACMLLVGIFYGIGSKSVAVGVLGGGFFGFIVGVILAAFLGGVAPKEVDIQERVEERQNIVALQDNINVEGSFGFILIAGGGSVDSEMRYHFFVKDKDGGIRKKSLPAEGYYKGEVKLYEGSDNPQYVVRKKFKYVKYEDVWKKFTLYGGPEELETIFELHVPEGTVVRDFRADLQ